MSYSSNSRARWSCGGHSFSSTLHSIRETDSRRVAGEEEIEFRPSSVQTSRPSSFVLPEGYTIAKIRRDSTSSSLLSLDGIYNVGQLESVGRPKFSCSDRSQPLSPLCQRSSIGDGLDRNKQEPYAPTRSIDQHQWDADSLCTSSAETDGKDQSKEEASFCFCWSIFHLMNRCLPSCHQRKSPTIPETRDSELTAAVAVSKVKQAEISVRQADSTLGTAL